ncbi:hypothetical protein [Spirillospora albida]|uniref:hypothetical protein n=1 Tax=Spirillospora albida TaxID=58123 RepID=UPI000A94BE58
MVAPEQESRDAYVRQIHGAIYVCPWETRLRSWLAFERFRRERSADVAATCVPYAVAERVARDFERWKRTGRSLRPHIRTSTWHVPLAWLVPFAKEERSLTLGARARDQGAASGDVLHEHGGHGPATAAPVRTLIYVTSMAEARRRISVALPSVRAGLGGEAAGSAGLTAERLEDLGRWLGEFHPGAIVELDYGGLVHLMDDDTLRADESAGEMAVAITGMRRGEVELAVAMYKRLLARWRPVRALESAN